MLCDGEGAYIYRNAPVMRVAAVWYKVVGGSEKAHLRTLWVEYASGQARRQKRPERACISVYFRKCRRIYLPAPLGYLRVSHVVDERLRTTDRLGARCHMLPSSLPSSPSRRGERPAVSVYYALSLHTILCARFTKHGRISRVLSACARCATQSNRLYCSKRG